jgi:N-hydroxyarylamine O-acetyltransferase
MNSAELSTYLTRIGADSASSAGAAPTIDLLTRIQRAHRSSIPFENLDLHLGKSISLERGAIFEKLVTNKRGEYCFEQNILFLDALTSLGFAGRPALGRVWSAAASASPAETPPRTHAVNIVEIDGADWLADAGFGSGDAPVMRLAEHRIATADGTEYRLQPDRDHGWMLLCNGSIQYSFTLDPIWPFDFIQANHYTSTFPDSRFIRNVIVSIIGREGFMSLFNDKFTISGKSRILSNRSEYRHVLREYFRLTLPDDDQSRLRLPFFESQARTSTRALILPLAGEGS